MDHVSHEIAGSFLAGKLPQEEARLMVRHLLSRCPICLTRVQARLRPASPAAYAPAVDRFLLRVRDVLASGEYGRERLAMDPDGTSVRFRMKLE
ncbi:MAG TPA: hypothetical protein VIA62_16390 [Thermoanaerobaculia bacterium]|jgi:hypothetical protein|nr:hypothetical protein [Thermoanaerobaculia bacterium]